MKHLNIISAIFLSICCEIALGSKPMDTGNDVLISRGEFVMGSPSSEAGRRDTETQHRVAITKDFYLMKYEVTQGEYQALMDANPSRLSSCGLNCPVERVSWYDALRYANALSDQEGLSRCYSGTSDDIRWDRSCTGYRLPTNAEWEYAARAGTKTAFYNGPITNIKIDPNADQIAWYRDNSEKTTHPVGQKKANAWGLYDMSGNVAEWVWDWYDGGYSADVVTDPTGPSSGSDRAIRGGHWRSFAMFARVASRRDFAPPQFRDALIGFRLARTVPGQKSLASPPAPAPVVKANPQKGCAATTASSLWFILMLGAASRLRRRKE